VPPSPARAIALLLALAASAATAKDPAQAGYERARSQSQSLKAHPERQRFRHHWLRAIDRFEQTATRYPQAAVTPACLLAAAELWRGLYAVSRRASDLDRALTDLQRLVEGHGRTSLADDALIAEAEIYLARKDRTAAGKALRQVQSEYAGGDKIARARELEQQLKGTAAKPATPAPDEAQDAGERQELTQAPGIKARLKVVIDPGHGGQDGGASGVGGLLEKEICLAVAKALKEQLAAHGVEAVLTRDTDTYVSLEQRAAIANRAGADAFVSIHANSHRRSGAQGIETYYLDTTADRYAMRLAARENQQAGAGNLELILADLATKVTTRESQALALGVQKAAVERARRFHAAARDHGVKAALFHVLLGARMPAVLVETGFLSNPQEAKLLAQPKYRQAMASAIAEGLLERLDKPMLLAAH
jgi:N-acetylmuramoyl-L-alanine amidase